MLFLIRKLKLQGVNVDDTALREKYGALSGIVGIILNLLLFAGKLVIALVTGSVAIIADAFNNLGDAGSSIMMLVGFKLAGKEPDTEHPFGHGRFEYITGLVVSFAIIIMGVELGISSVSSIADPKTVEYSAVTIIILSVSIVAKFYMALYNKGLGKLFNSCALDAVAMDSLADTISTFAVLISLIISTLTGVQLDSYAGLLIAVFILYSGFKSTRETIKPLLGAPPSDEFVNKIEQIVMQNPTIVGMHDLVVHDYGPGRVMISLHAEVPSDIDVFKAHSIIDDIENELGEKLNAEAVIHYDPIDINDEELERLKGIIAEVLKGIDERLSMHDLRYVPGDTHTNLLFDVVVPYDVKMGQAEISRLICSGVLEVLPNHNCVMKFDTLKIR